MRIISGIYKGRRFSPPKKFRARPTTDLAKESLFNILDNYIYYEDTSVLDLFTGTGSISYEFASRGCKDIVAVDIDYKCVDFINKTIIKLNTISIQVIRANTFLYLQNCNRKFDIVFADPPYDLNRIEEIPDFVFSNQLLNEGGQLIVEHPGNVSFESHPKFKQRRIYSRVNFTFFESVIL